MRIVMRRRVWVVLEKSLERARGTVQRPAIVNVRETIRGFFN